MGDSEDELGPVGFTTLDVATRKLKLVSAENCRLRKKLREVEDELGTFRFNHTVLEKQCLAKRAAEQKFATEKAELVKRSLNLGTAVVNLRDNVSRLQQENNALKVDNASLAFKGVTNAKLEKEIEELRAENWSLIQYQQDCIKGEQSAEKLRAENLNLLLFLQSAEAQSVVECSDGEFRQYMEARVLETKAKRY